MFFKEKIIIFEMAFKTYSYLKKKNTKNSLKRGTVNL